MLHRAPLLIPGGGSVATADITDAGAAGIAVVQAATAAAARTAVGAGYLAGAVTDLSTTNLVLDLDAEAGVTETTGRVSAWASQVGALVAAQGTAGRRPVYVAQAFNGRGALRFDGATSVGSQGEVLLIPNGSIDWAALSVYVVARARRRDTALDADRVVLVRQHDTTHMAPYYRWAIYQKAAGISYWADGGTEVATSLDTGDQWSDAAIYELSVGAAGRRLSRSGRTYEVNASPTSVTYPNATALGIGGDALAGASEGLESWRGDIARILIYSAQHTNTEREAVLRHLSQRYGVPLEG